MPDVYRRAAKDVHRALMDGGVRFEHNPCVLDGGGEWRSDIPDGHRCPICFAGYGELQRRSRREPVFLGSPRLNPKTVAGGAAALALIAAVLGGQSALGPVVLETGASLSPSPTLSPAASLNGASALPLPSTTPAPTAGPSSPPVPRPTVRPFVPESTPEPTRVCVHPGNHNGVKDICDWPGNR